MSQAGPANDPAASVAASRSDGKKHLLIACSGSVATIKLQNIILALARHDISIRVILTASASEFLNGSTPEQPSLAAVRALPNVEALHLDADEWVQPWRRGASILHIELRRCKSARMSAESSMLSFDYATNTGSRGGSDAHRTTLGEHARQDRQRFLRQPPGKSRFMTFHHRLRSD